MTHILVPQSPKYPIKFQSKSLLFWTWAHPKSTFFVRFLMWEMKIERLFTRYFALTLYVLPISWEVFQSWKTHQQGCHSANLLIFQMCRGYIQSIIFDITNTEGGKTFADFRIVAINGCEKLAPSNLPFVFQDFAHYFR